MKKKIKITNKSNSDADETAEEMKEEKAENENGAESESKPGKKLVKSQKFQGNQREKE